MDKIDIRNQPEPEDTSENTSSTALDAKVTLYTINPNHPLAHLAGVFENEPLWDELMQAIEEYREETNASENIEG